MAKPGPKSAAEIAIGTLAPRKDGRPNPPADMTAPEQTLWRLIVESEPPDWFETGARQQLLRLYCEHAVFRAELHALISDCKIGVIADGDCGADFERMLRARDRETKQLVSLATRMRLTNQSRYTPQAASTAGRNNLTGAKPWGNAVLDWE